jgi:hypothetical protein
MVGSGSVSSGGGEDGAELTLGDGDGDGDELTLGVGDDDGDGLDDDGLVVLLVFVGRDVGLS